MLSRLVCAMLLAGLACGACASTVLFDFEDDAEARIVPDRGHGATVVTNICATSGAHALWMGPENGQPPAEGYGFATVYWTDPAKNDWSRFDRLAFDASNLSSESVTLVFYLYDSACKKRKSARFSFALGAGATRRIEVRGARFGKALELIRRGAAAGVGVDDVAAALGCSRRSAEIRFRKWTGTTVLDAIHAARVDLAKRFLADGMVRIGDLPSRCGFKSAATFRRVFSAVAGMSPRDYVRTLRSCPAPRGSLRPKP